MSSPIRPPLWITETDGNPSGRPVNKIVVSNGTLTINGTTAEITTGGGSGGSGTVTNVSSTDSFISITNPNTTPSITIQDATTSQDGILTSTDWNTFNNKSSNSGTVTSVGSSQSFVSVASATTTPSITIGNASGSATGVLLAADWTTFNNKGSGTVTNVQGALPILSSGGTAPSISINQSGASSDGYLSSTDWNTFNNKSSQTVTLTTTGTSGVATLIGSVLNIPNYATSGGSGTVTVGTNAGNNNLAYFSGATEISNTNNISINAAAGSGDFFGQLEASKHIASSDGSAAIPSFSFSSATNLGFYKDGSSAASFTSAGVRQMSFDASGRIRLGNGSVANLTTYGSDLVLDTDVGANSGSITVSTGANNDIDIIPDGTGSLKVNGTGSLLGSKTIFVSDLNSTAVDISSKTSVTNTPQTVLQLINGTTSTAAAGSGAKIQFRNGDSNFAGFTAGTIHTEQIDTSNHNMFITPQGTGKLSIGTLPFKADQTVGAGQDNYVLTYDNGNGSISLEAAGGGGGISWSTPVDSTLTPDTTSTYDIGTSSALFRSAYFSSTVNTGALQISGDITRPNGSMKITAGGSQDSRAHIFLPNNETNMKILGSSGSNTDIILDTRYTTGTGEIQLKTKGSTRFAVGADGELFVGTSAGTSGQVLTSGGAGAVPTWAAAGGGGVTFPLKADSGSSGVPSYAFSADTDTGLYLAGASNLGIAAGGFTYMSIGSLGSVQFDKKALFNGATANAPNGFSTDTNTGFFQPTADTIGFSTAGTEKIRIGSSGEILIGGTAAGTSGQVLTSGGTSAAPSWATADKRNYQGLLSPISTSSKTWDITRQTPFSTNSNGTSQTGSIFNNAGFAFCFSAPQTGVPTEVGVNFGSGSSGGLNFAIYNSNSDGAPNQLIAEGTTSYSSNAVVYDTSLTGQSGGSAGEMTVGELMWFVMTRTDGGVATIMSCSVSGSRGKTSTSTTLNTAGNCIETSSFSASTSFTNTAPAITSWNAQNILIPLIGVRF